MEPLDIYISCHGAMQQDYFTLMDGVEVWFYCPPGKILSNNQAYLAWKNKSPTEFITTRYISRYSSDFNHNVPNHHGWFAVEFAKDCGIFLNSYEKRDKLNDFFFNEVHTLSDIVSFFREAYPNKLLRLHWLACRS